VYYSSNSGGNWNQSTTWSTLAFGSPVNTGTFPNSSDTALIADGHVIFITHNAKCAFLMIGQGVSGSVEFAADAPHTMNISGSLVISNGANLSYIGNASIQHVLKISGSISNMGMMDLFSDANDYVDLSLYGPSDAVISGSGAWQFNNVDMNKGGKTYRLEIQSCSFLSAAPPASSTPNLTLSKGTFVYNNPGSCIWSDPLTSSFTINNKVVLEIAQGTLQMLTNGDRVLNYGKIYLNGGNLDICNPLSGTEGIINIYAGGSPYPELEVDAGILNLYGGFSVADTGVHPVKFKLRNGIININGGVIGTSLHPFRIKDFVDSRFVMTGGQLNILRPSNNPTYSDFVMGGSNTIYNVPGGQIVFGNPSTAFDFDFEPNIFSTIPNVKLEGASGTSLIPSNGNPVEMRSLMVLNGCSYDVSYNGLNSGSTNLTLNNIADGIYALYNEGTFLERTATVSLTGYMRQTIHNQAGDNTFNNLTINNGGGVELSNNLYVNGILNLQSGVIYSNAGNELIMNAGSSIGMVSDLSYVEGPVRKLGNTSFTFPVGGNSMYRPISISSPSLITDAFTATYFGSDPDPLYSRSSLDLGLNHVSSLEWWELDQTAGSSSVSVTLSWNPNSVVDSLPFLRVSHWNGSAWMDEGQGSVTGDIMNGTLTSSSTIGSFSPFTLGSSNGRNPLPVNFIGFKATKQNASVLLEWQTASETNNDYFDIERSNDGINFSHLTRISGSGTTTIAQNYSTLDAQPFPARTVYRLTQTDFNGSTELLGYAIADFRNFSTFVSPNPATNTNRITITSDSEFSGMYEIKLSDVFGRVIHIHNQYIQSGNDITLDLSKIDNLGSGLYQLIISDQFNNGSHQLLMVNK